jgi:hypothetical protein
VAIDPPYPTSTPAPDLVGGTIDITDRDAHAGPDGNESLGELIAATTRDLSALMRTEVELAKTEIKEEVGQAARAGAMIGAGALIGYLALLLVLLAAAWGIAEAVAPWAGLLIVGVVTAAVAAVLIVTGRNKLAAVEAAPNTIETLQEDVQWAKQQLS